MVKIFSCGERGNFSLYVSDDIKIIKTNVNEFLNKFNKKPQIATCISSVKK